MARSPGRRIARSPGSAAHALARGLAGAALLAAGACPVGCSDEAPGRSPAVTATPGTPAPDASHWAPVTALGEGFVVWESNRSGRWRIWQRRLDGSHLRRLSPDEPGRDHFAPHVAPDGRHLVYLSHPQGTHAYSPPGNADVRLHLLRIDDGRDRVLAPSARSYEEDRAAVWLDARSLVYIRRDGSTWRIDIHTGEEDELLPPRSGEQVFLLDPTLRWAVSGVPAFSHYDAEARRVDLGRRQTGCQPYFSRDGRWGFWTAVPGGPLRRIDLRSGEQADLLVNEDARMPGDFGYLYYPMVSAGQRLLALGASRDEHDHFEADYEIFLVPVDPASLDPTGTPVRYTFHPGTDRFPDVFVAGRELGRIRGEAPLHVRLEAPPPASGGDGAWTWSLGDGAEARGGAVEHTYTAAGTYRVEARRADGETLGGEVQVEPRRPPHPLRALVRDGGREVTVLFDEPVALPEGASARFRELGPAASLEMAPAGRALRVRPPRPLRAADRLVVQGIADRADPPNVLERGEVKVEPAHWPARAEGLVFVWRDGAHRNLVRDPETGRDHAYHLRGRGAVHLDGHHVIVSGGGGYRVENFGALAARARESGRMALELTFRARDREPAHRGALLAYGDGPDRRRVVLAQEGTRLVLYLSLDAARPGGERFELAEIPDRGPHHVAVAFRPEQLVAWLDGEIVFERMDLPGSLAHWGNADLWIGTERRTGDDWHGRLEGIALYDRFLDPDEVASNATAALERARGREPIPQVRVRARLARRSEPPTLEQVLPYRDALVVHEYRVLEVLDGELPADTIRVAHWALLHGDRRAAADRQPGSEVELLLEPFDANPQVASLYRADDLEVAPRLPLFLAVRP